MELNFKISSFIFFITIVLALFALFVFFPSGSEKQLTSSPQKIFFSAENITVNSEAELKGKYFYEKGITSIEFNSLVFDCKNKKECEFSFNQIFNKTGTQEITLILNSENESIPMKEIIKVFEVNEKKCLDNTLFGECSSKIIGNYCNNGKIEFNCIKCSCAKEFECISNKCILTDFSISMELTNFPKLAGKTIPLTISLQNNSLNEIPAETQFKVELIESNKIISSQEITLKESIKSKNSLEIPATFPLTDLTEGVHIFSIKLIFPLTNSILSESKAFETNLISETSTPPENPFSLKAEVYGNALDLSWQNLGNRTSSFNVYESISVQSTHISYSFAGSTQNNSFSFDSLEKGIHYFVVTAVDPFGLESEYSEPLKVQVN
ncbi:MAG: hypothetical protein JW703_04065 [Candidatus Diapherotrites archaeon]|nr:hypothetical protein [Candidatus Diapherotrites archaeon]